MIDGRAVAATVRADVAAGVEAFVAETGRRPRLGTVLVGDDPASHIYVSNKHKAAEEVGIESTDTRLTSDTPRDELIAVLQGLGADPEISGILLQIPLPDHLDATRWSTSSPRPRTSTGSRGVGGEAGAGPARAAAVHAQGIIELLDAYEVPLEGAEAVVLGRSQLVGRPVAGLLLQRNATVTTAHSRTRELGAVSRAPTCSSPPWAGRGWCRATGSSRARRSSTSASTASRRVWSATSTSSPPRSARA